MPRCGATFDENSVPPWTRGDFRGVLDAGTDHHGHRCASRTPPTEGIFKGEQPHRGQPATAGCLERAG